MQIFHCDHCHNLVFFENTRCVKCERLLAYLPDAGEVCSLDPLGDGRWRARAWEADTQPYRLCANYRDRNVCNWAMPASDPHDRCLSCRLTRTAPNLDIPGHEAAWYKLEVAKRRLVYTLLALGLPVVDKAHDPDGGLAFDFLSDFSDGSDPVLTGHAGGVITINVAEADDAERERRKQQLHEPYRTLLGHVRHEIGHYYWDRLIRDRPRLDRFRATFGDERADYAAALSNHYASGPPADWAQQFVSAYASTHPWEDWAETWAHYLHVVDTLDTAAACGLSIQPRRPDEPALPAIATADRPLATPFDRIIESWFPLTYVLNNLNRGLGLPDGYPFVLSTPTIEKMRFVHDTIAEADTRKVQAEPVSRRPRP
jgi:hypothetical protein